MFEYDTKAFLNRSVCKGPILNAAFFRMQKIKPMSALGCVKCGEKLCKIWQIACQFFF